MAEDKSPNLLSLAPQFGTLAVVLALAAAFIPGTTKSPKPDTVTTTATEAAAETETPTPTEAFAKFLRESDVVSDRIPIRLLEPDRSSKSGGRLNMAMIATLPDPIATDFGYWFDQCVESMCRAMADADNYVLERYWFPWLTPTAAKAAAKGDANRRASEPGWSLFAGLHLGPWSKPAKPADRRSDQIGALVFRKNAERRVVLIVPENTLSGVRLDSMHSALELMPAAVEKTRDIRILGPSFSGSQPSILDAIGTWEHGGDANVKLISGSAIGLQPVRELKSVKEFSIRSTHTHIKIQINAMMQYLANPGDTKPTDSLDSTPEAKHIAYLVESNSGFGSIAAGAATENVNRPWILRFPLHVSKLTAILSTEQRERDERLGLSSTSKLTALDEARGKRDLVPATDEIRTAELNKRLLDDYCTVLRRERIRYIGIIATDPRDKLYLFDLLQRECPNARLFTHGADNHFVHPTYYRPMRGVLLVTNYPLLPQSQQWTRMWENEDDTRRLPFPSGYSEGLYNATLAQLGAGDRMLDYRPPAFARPNETHVPSTFPPLWITTVSETGQFIPLAYFVNEKKGEPDEWGWGAESRLMFELPRKAPVDAEALNTPKNMPPRLSDIGVAMALFLAFAGYAAFCIRRAYPDLRQAIVNSFRPMLFRDWCTALVGAALLLGVTPFAIYFHTLLHYGGFFHFLFSADYLITDVLFLLVIGVGAIAPVLLVFTALPMLAWLRSGFVRGPTPAISEASPAEAPRWWFLLSAGVAVAAILFTVGLFMHLYGKGRAEPSQMLFLERSSELLGGASAVLPCLLIALGIGMFGLIGFWMLEERERLRIESPYPTAEDAMPSEQDPTGKALRDIRTSSAAIEDLWQASDPRHTWTVYAVAAVSGLAFALPACFWAHRTWDGRFWNVLFLCGFSALAAFAAVSVFRFVTLWSCIKRILRAMAGIPMVGAFDRLPLRTSVLLSRFLMAGRRRSSLLEVQLRLLAELRSALHSAPEETAWLEPCRHALDEAAEIDDPDIANQRASRLSFAARALVTALLPLWAKKNVCDAYGTHTVEKDEPPETPQAVAEQFIAIQAILFVGQFFSQLRSFAISAWVTAGCLLLALTEYPFEPEHLVMITGVSLAAIVVGLVIWGLVQINKNEIVSRVTRTTPGRFSLDSAPMVMNAITLIGPLIVIVLVQVSGRLRSVIEPVVGLFR